MALYPQLPAFFPASIPSSAVISGVVRTLLQAPPAPRAIENAAALTLLHIHDADDIVLAKREIEAVHFAAEFFNGFADSLAAILRVFHEAASAAVVYANCTR